MNKNQPMMCTYTKRLLTVWVVGFFAFGLSAAPYLPQAVFAEEATSTQQTLGVSGAEAVCTASITVEAGDTVLWDSGAWGDDITISWEGSDGLSGSDETVEHTYPVAGSVSGTVTVESETDANCDISASVLSHESIIPSVTLTAEPEEIEEGEPSELSWTSEDAISCESEDFDTSGDTSGTVAVSPTSTTEYSISCMSETDDSAQDSAVITVTDVVEPNIPSVDLKANGENGPLTLTTDATSSPVELSWETINNPSLCVASGAWNGFKTTSSGNEDVTLGLGTHAFTLACSNEHGSSTDSVSVTVMEEDEEEPKQCLLVVEGDSQPTVTLKEGDENIPLQDVLDDAGYNIDADDDQVNYATWDLEKDVTTLEITYIDAIADNDNVFGYYTNDDLSTFTPIFQKGNHSGFGSVTDATSGDTFIVEVTATSGEKIGFAIATENGSSRMLSTDNGQNPNNGAHAVSYDLGNTYVIGFEDLVSGSDKDYQDMVVEVRVVGCEDEEPETLPSVDLKANGSNGPVTVDEGATTTLSWTVSDADSCVAGDDWSGSKAATSSSEDLGVLSVGDHSFNLTCENEHGTSSDSVSVTVKKDGGNGGGDNTPDVDLKANGSDGPVTVQEGATTTLSWTLGNSPETCVAGGDWSGSKATSSDSESLGILAVGDYSFSLACANEHGTSSDSVSVTVKKDGGNGGGDNTPDVDLKANGSNGPITINEGATTTLTWDVTNADSCDASGGFGWTGSKSATSGSQVLNTLSIGTHGFSLACANEHGTSTDSVSVTVKKKDGGNGGGGGTGGGGGVTTGGGGSISGGIAPDRRSVPEGEVLGVQSCTYLEDFLHINWTNDPVEVAKLQYFLREFEGYDIDMTTVFDQHTFNTVVQFQERYFDQVLAPWGHTAGTGFVYITTKTRINEIVCQRQIAFTDAEREEMRQFKNYLASIGGDVQFAGGQGGIGLGGTGTVGADGIVGGVQDDTIATSATSTTGSTANGIVGTATNMISTTSGAIAGFAVAAFNFPDTPAEALQCFVNLLLILAIVFLIGTIIVNAQETDHLSRNTVWARRLMLYITGLIIAGIIAYFASLYCLIVPLLVILIILAVSLLVVVNRENGDIDDEGSTISSSGDSHKRGLRDSINLGGEGSSSR
ncbi:MAG: DUF4114 domain-containing protein [Candidatus Paceibacterota bacterium]